MKMYRNFRLSQSFVFSSLESAVTSGVFLASTKILTACSSLPFTRTIEPFFYGITLQVTGRYRPSLRKVQNLNGFVSMNSAVGGMVDKFFNLWGVIAESKRFVFLTYIQKKFLFKNLLTLSSFVQA